jgi:hypothetical protein
MEDLRGQAFVQKKLKPHFICYAAAVVTFLIVLSAAILFDNYLTSLDTAANNLTEITTGLIKARTTVKDVSRFLDQADSIVPRTISAEPPTKYLYAGLDSVRSIMGKALLEIGRVEYRSDEVVMPVTITGPVNDYPAFVEGIGRLQGMRFPFFTITGLSMKTNREERNQVPPAYEIKGTLSAPQLSGDQGNPGSQREGEVRE